MDVVTRWTTRPDRLITRIVEIRGGNMPPDVRQQLTNATPPDLGPESTEYGLTQAIKSYVAHHFLPDPRPLEIGGQEPIAGTITKVRGIGSGSSTSENLGGVQVSYMVGYPNNLSSEGTVDCRLDQFPDDIRKMIVKIYRETNTHAKRFLWDQYGSGQIDPKKWSAEKLEIFISYRASGMEIATRLFDELGSYHDASLFLPRMDRSDLQAGDWMTQLMEIITSCPVFVPVLTRDFLDGPIARPELHQALRQHYSEAGKRVVPILLQGTPHDYDGHFIGNFHMVQAQNGLTEELIKEVASLCLGASRNPFES